MKGLQRYLDNVQNTDIYQCYKRHWSPVLLSIEFLLNLLYLQHGPLHPIDYPTYLQQAAVFTRKHQWDYALSYGKTGPLVYPGGHAWLFIGFERLFGLPEDPNWSGYLGAQCIFLLLCLMVTAVVHRIYRLASPTPELDCVFFLFTLRARNVFVNGLFNDGWQVFFSLLGVLCLLERRRPSTVLAMFSLGASIKMNGLLWAPGVALHYVSSLGWKETLMACRYGLATQAVLALPFIMINPGSYIGRSFQLTRSFSWFNSVSWKFIPEPIFNSTSFSLFLLCMHLGTCALLLGKHYRYYMKTTTPPSGTSNSLHSNYQIAILLFTTHFTGIVFSRSLHYSFYIWYFHTLPLLYHAASIPWLFRPFLFALIEISWNMWQPYRGHTLESCATWYGSLGMFAGHLVILYGLCRDIGREI